MEKLRVAIYDHNTEYSWRLMNYLNGRYGEYMDAVSFTQKEQLIKKIEEQKFDCVVADDEEGMGAASVIRICEEDCEEGFYRYSSAKLLAKKMLEQIREGKEYKAKKGEMIAVYSPAGGVGKTRYALNKAEELDGIYMGMEDFCSIETGEYWMEQMLFLIKEREEEICSQIDSHLQWMEGVRILPSARCFLDYRYMNHEDYGWFLEKLREEKYQTFVFDIGVGSLADLKILDLFDRIILITSEEKSKQQKIQLFLKLMQQIVPGIRSKITFVAEEK